MYTKLVWKVVLPQRAPPSSAILYQKLEQHRRPPPACRTSSYTQRRGVFKKLNMTSNIYFYMTPLRLRTHDAREPRARAELHHSHPPQPGAVGLVNIVRQQHLRIPHYGADICDILGGGHLVGMETRACAWEGSGGTETRQDSKILVSGGISRRCSGLSPPLRALGGGSRRATEHPRVCLFASLAECRELVNVKNVKRGDGPKNREGVRYRTPIAARDRRARVKINSDIGSLIKG